MAVQKKDEQATSKDSNLAYAKLSEENGKLRTIAEKAINENQILRATIKALSHLL
ncbi:MAG: hypothetical protein IKB64_04805 [Paludibacteraceae bacterium]|nr:hypothetical protein [Paludibacteraceae bacterium]